MGTELVIATPRWSVPLLEAARYKGAEGGRASGKSHERAEALVERCVMQKTDAVCIRESQKSLKQSVKKLIESKMVKMGVAHLFNCGAAMIKGPYGGTIIFEGMQSHTAETIKSLEDFDIAWVEEAQTLSQRSLDMLRPTIRKPGSELWFTWNPRFPTDPVDVLLRGPTSHLLPGGCVVVEANYRDNPWLPKEMLEEAEYDRARDPDKFAHIWLGQYQRNSEARVFRNWRIDEELEAPAGVTFRNGLDFGFSTDPTAGLRCWVEGRNLYVDYEVYGFNVEINDLPEWLTQIPEIEKWPMVADSARPETISYLRNHGFPKIVGAVKGSGSVEEGIEFLKSYTIIVHPRCVHLIDELTLYSYKLDKKTDEVLPILEDKKNHLIDALRYALEGMRRIAQAKPLRPPRQRSPLLGGWAG